VCIKNDADLPVISRSRKKEKFLRSKKKKKRISGIWIGGKIDLIGVFSS